MNVVERAILEVEKWKGFQLLLVGIKNKRFLKKIKGFFEFLQK